MASPYQDVVAIAIAPPVLSTGINQGNDKGGRQGLAKGKTSLAWEGGGGGGD